MSKVRNAGVAGGVAMLMLWGGIGFFFGKGKGKGKGDKAGKVKVEHRVEPRDRRQPRMRVVKVSKHTAPTQGRIANTPPKETFRYIIRMTFIHPVLPNGKRSKQTISIQELIVMGKKAKRAKQELYLKISGDTRAKWLNRLKENLKKHKVSYSISDDF